MALTSDTTRGMPITRAPIVVTGASGFIGSHIVQQLLARGYRVRGTVRDASKQKELAHLRAFEGAAERLELVSADLVAPHAFDAHVRDAHSVIHTASPYVLTVKDAQRDLVDPAVQGTLSLLQACQGAADLKRVVLTSSMAAVTDEPDREHVLTEADWNDKSSLTRNPYYYSKTLAERAGWQFMQEHKPSFDLVVINPFLVLGPAFSSSLNTSNQVLSDLLSGAYPAIMNMAWGMVDVRDVALAHVLAMETPSASGRYICANATIKMRALVSLLRERGYSDYKLPKLGLDSGFGDGLVWLLSFAQPSGVASYVRTHIGREPRFDNSKIQRELGLSFRPLESSIEETLVDLKRWGHLKEPR